MKNYITINKAGKDSSNPILQGVHKKINFIFANSILSITAYTDNESPANAKSVDFTQTSALQYYINLVAGIAPFDYLDEPTYLRITAACGAGTTVTERVLYVASQPASPVQIFDYDSAEWQNAEADYSQMTIEVCGVKLLHTYIDEFGFNTFGGYKYVSVYDGGSLEADTSEEYVKRQLNQLIQDARQIYLVKHDTGVVENHWVRFHFKNSLTDAGGFTHDIKIKSIDCYGFLLQNPIYI